ncbi:hypothetical protein DSO57_1020727 [Entomophthora muscae]|uniref:Uncharacterized protein n=1 Tax=Entomophthora muscae TaxID=34485 RepID=A0ACC2UD68_9FUNG|nr:hypothetical protein DSO57_1020727 [Entomophthora muscae]
MPSIVTQIASEECLEAPACDYVLSSLPNKVVLNLWFTNLFPYIFLILFHLHTPKRQHPSAGIDSQTPVDKPKAFDYYCPPNTPFGPVHFTEYPPNPDHKPWTLEDLQWYTCPNTPKESYQIVCDSKAITIYPLIFNGKYNNPAAYLVPMEPPLTPKPTISTPPTSDAIAQSSQFLGVLYLALTGLIDSVLPAAGPWAMAWKALSYLVKLGPIIWWAMPVPASTPLLPAGAPRYSWYPENEWQGDCEAHMSQTPEIDTKHIKYVPLYQETKNCTSNCSIEQLGSLFLTGLY